MIGLYSSIPIIVSITLPIGTLFLIYNRIKICTSKKERDVLHYLGLLQIFFLIICATSLANSICYDVYETNGFSFLVVNKISNTLAIAGLFADASLDMILLYQFHVLINIDRLLVKRFVIFFLVWLVISLTPRLLETIMYSAKLVNHGTFYDISSYVNGIGAFSYAIYHSTQSLFISFRLRELSLVKRVRDEKKLFRHLFLVSIFIIIADIFVISLMVSLFFIQYPSDLYMILQSFLGLCGVIHFSLHTNLVMDLRKAAVQIIQHSNTRKNAKQRKVQEPVESVGTNKQSESYPPTVVVTKK